MFNSSSEGNTFLVSRVNKSIRLMKSVLGLPSDSCRSFRFTIVITVMMSFQPEMEETGSYSL